jgi:hypothetical protein
MKTTIFIIAMLLVFAAVALDIQLPPNVASTIKLVFIVSTSIITIAILCRPSNSQRQMFHGHPNDWWQGYNDAMSLAAYNYGPDKIKAELMVKNKSTDYIAGVSHYLSRKMGVLS